MEKEFVMYPRCWDCQFYFSGDPTAKQLECCKHKSWYRADGKITAINLIRMIDQMENSELCNLFEYPEDEE